MEKNVDHQSELRAWQNPKLKPACTIGATCISSLGDDPPTAATQAVSHTHISI